MLKSTFKVSLAVALLTVGSIAGGYDRVDSNNMIPKKMQNEFNSKRAYSNNFYNIVLGEETILPLPPKGDLGEERIFSIPKLRDSQRDNLLYIIEEEKVAKDVYKHFYQTWGERIFFKVANSEDRHIASIEKLLSKYKIDLPMTMDEEGIFTNEKLQSVYNELIAKGDISLKEALKVGIEIEETDIEDLEELLNAEVLNKTVENLYNRLLKGSYNHLGSFNRQLNRQR